MLTFPSDDVTWVTDFTTGNGISAVLESPRCGSTPIAHVMPSRSAGLGSGGISSAIASPA